MIVLDIESSGLDTGKCGIWQIGAIDLNNPQNDFLSEGRIDDDDEILNLAKRPVLEVIGKTEEELRDKNKQSQKQLILNCLDWLKNLKEKLIVGQNIGWDLNFIQNKCIKYDIMDKFRESAGQRGMDLHTIAQTKYYQINRKYLLKEKRGSSDMNLTNILQFCGIPDYRIKMVEGNTQEVEKKGTTHNALEDCKLEGECFSRLTYGKNLFPEYSQYKIPKELSR